MLKLAGGSVEALFTTLTLEGQLGAEYQVRHARANL